MACPFSGTCGCNGGAWRNRSSIADSNSQQILQARACCGGEGQSATRQIRCGDSANANAVTAMNAAAMMRRVSCTQNQNSGCNCCRCCCQSRQTINPPCGDRIGRQLYGASATTEVMYTTCSDPCTGRAEYRIDSRNPYWPTFARPRWLTCEQLYGCQNRRK